MEHMIADVADFDAKFAEAGDVVMALFTGSKDPATGESWCDDCQAADPVIDAAKPKLKHNLLVVHVGQKEDWKGNPENPWRTHPKTMCTGVPTLIRWEQGSEMVRLVEDQLMNQQIVEMTFSK